MHMIQYKVAPEHAAENEQLVQAIIAELDEVQPAGLRYAALKLEDGVSFIHIVSKDDDGGPLPGGELNALRAFHAGLRERCVEGPVRTSVGIVGSYELLDDRV